MNAHHWSAIDAFSPPFATNLQTVVFRVDFHAGDFGCGYAALGLGGLCVFNAFWLRPKGRAVHKQFSRRKRWQRPLPRSVETAPDEQPHAVKMPKASQLVAGGRARHERHHRIAKAQIAHPGRDGSHSANPSSRRHIESRLVRVSESLDLLRVRDYARFH